MSGADVENLPWSAAALAAFRQRMQGREFALLEPGDDPASARLDAVFSLPPELWPVLPPGSLYCLEGHDPRVGFTYLQHAHFPESKVRVSTYFGKWCRDKVDFVVAWQPPRAAMGSAWSAGSGPPPPELPWEARQVLAHTTSGEYQYTRTRLRFRGCTSALTPDQRPVEYCDVHGVDHADTKAANEGAPRNSDKDRDAHLLDPPKPNTWGEHARRPLIGRLRSGGGGAYCHHVMYDYSGLRTSCGRRVPAGYFFTLAPAAPPTPPRPYTPAGTPPPAAAAPVAPGSRPASPAAHPPPRPSSAPRARRPAGAPLSASVSWLDQAAARGAGAAAAGPSSRSLRSLRSSVSVSAGAGRKPSFTSGGGGGVGGGGPQAAPSPVASASQSALALSRSVSAAGMSAAGAGAGGGIGGIGGGGEAGGGAGAAVALSPPSRWRTYGVPFAHPIHSSRAGELAAWVAASGEGARVRGFSDTAAVMKVAEAHLRLPRPFVPAPLVLTSWADVPRMYAEHLAAARALMPVSDEDAASSTRLHMMLHHLQHAATLEYDRLDAKLALLPLMARLGRKSAEIDAWLQVIVAHATYLYAQLQITNAQRWPQPRLDPRRSARLLSPGAAPAGPLPDPLAPPASATGSPRLSPAPQPGTPPAPQSLRQPFHLTPSHSLDSPRAASESRALQTVGLALPPGAERSALAGAAAGGGGGEDGGGGALPRPYVSLDEWAAVTRIMDTCRHAELYEQWVRLRPLMNGTAQPGAYSLSRHASSILAGLASEEEAAAPEAQPLPGSASLAAEPFTDGPMNGDLLQYLSADMDAMDSPGYDPPPPPYADFPPPRGFRGVGPPPPPRSRPVPAPVRTRGPEETPLPPDIAATDVWHERTKTGQAAACLDSPDGPEERADPGAVRHGQSAVKRLQAAKAWAQTRQAAVRVAMRAARGLPPSPDYVWGPGDPPSPGDGEEEEAAGDDDDCDVESVASGATGLTSSTGRSGSTTTWGRDQEAAGGARSLGGARREAAAGGAAPRKAPAPAPGRGTQTAPRFWEPSEAEAAAAAARARAASDAEIARQLVLSGNAKSREQMLDEALAAAEAAIASLSPRPPPPNLAPAPGTRSTYDHYQALTQGTEADPHVAYTFDRKQSSAPANNGDAVWKRLQFGWRGRDGGETSGDDGGGGALSGGSGGSTVGGAADDGELQKLDPATHQLHGSKEANPELQTVELAKKRTGLSEYGVGTGIISGFGIVDYETAMARRRAISAAVTKHEAGRDMSRAEVLDLFTTFCNLTNRREMVEELRSALHRPVSAAALATAALAAGPSRLSTASPSPGVSASGGYASGGGEAVAAGDGDVQKQRIRVVAWLLGVTWRRISNETYASFVCRVLGWPPDMAAALPRTRATHVIARALVRGHYMADVPAPQHRG